MPSASDIYGQIGAAKAFSSSVAYSLELDTEENESEIRELEQELAKTDDEKEKRRLQRRIKKLKRRNKIKNFQSKVAKGATDFLTKICSYIDIGIEAIIKLIAKIIVSVLPALEVSVKMLLLTNIKKMVSCSIDPRIPDEWRLNGVLLNERLIDPRSILKSSPYSKWGKYNYFGVYYDKDQTEARPTSELTRAEDMNAFLWYAKNCALFVSPNVVRKDQMSEYFADCGEGDTFFNKHVFKGKPNHLFVEGSIFKQSSESTTIFLCSKRELRSDGIYYTIIPVSDRWTGVTWYKDRTSITGTEKMKDINYNKSKPLFNIEYLGTCNPYIGYPDGNFRFSILPKPFSTAGGFIVDIGNNVNTMEELINRPDIEFKELVGSDITTDQGMSENKFQGIQSPIPYYARFNDKGVYDKRGRYSINTLKYYVIQEETRDKDVVFGIYNSSTSEHIKLAELLFHKQSKSFELKTDDNDKAKFITECYAGMTVYEFNYDYVVSMKLFDAQSIAMGIVNSLMNINRPSLFKRGQAPSTIGSEEDSVSNIEQMKIDAYVDRLVEKMIDTEDREYSDCFYSFSNEDYELMEQKVADDIANNTLVRDNGENTINDIYNTIDAYDADATLNERIETISIALRKAANACGFNDNIQSGSADGNSNGVSQSPENSGGGSVSNFITQAIQFLVGAIVNSILTPKVLMLLQVNKMLMGTYALPTKPGDLKENYTYDIEDVLNGLSGLLSGIIKEVINTIQKELLRIILERISEMMAGFLKRLGMEYVMKWVLLLKQLLACFNFNRNNIGNNRLQINQYDDVISSVIDQVDYADINVLMDEIIPKTNPC